MWGVDYVHRMCFLFEMNSSPPADFIEKNLTPFFLLHFSTYTQPLFIEEGRRSKQSKVKFLLYATDVGWGV